MKFKNTKKSNLFLFLVLYLRNCILHQLKSCPNLYRFVIETTGQYGISINP